MSKQIQIEVDASGFNDAPSTVKVERGMKVYFSNIQATQSIHIQKFSSSYWTKSSNAMLIFGSPHAKYVKSNAPMGTDALTVYDPVRGSAKTVYIQVVPSSSGHNPLGISTIETEYKNLRVNQFKVSGTYSFSSNAGTIIHMRSDDPEVRFRLFDPADNYHEEDFYGTWVSDYYADSTYRRQFQIGVRAPTEAYATKKFTVSIGTRRYAFTVTSGAEIVPTLHEEIGFGHTSGELSLLAVRGFFGGGSNLRDYFRNGRNVPDMSANYRIPTSGELRLTDFRGAATALFIAKHPSNSTKQLVTTYSDDDTAESWSIWNGAVDDWDLGYSKFIKNNAEFRYDMSVTYSSGYGTTNPRKAPVLSSYSGSPGTWSSSNKSVTVRCYGARNEEYGATVRVNMYARHKNHRDKVVSTSAYLTIRVVGT